MSASSSKPWLLPCSPLSPQPPNSASTVNTHSPNYGTNAIVQKNAKSEGGSQSNPQTAINGFIAIILTLLCSVLYLIWLLVPQHILHRLHISYYPDKYWAFAIPAMLTMWGTYYFFVSVCLIFVTTHPLDDGRCITDVDTRKDTELNCGALTQSAGSVAPWADIPVPVASNLLFQPWVE